MKAQLEAVQKVFWILLGCSVATAAAAAPVGNNRQLKNVLSELTRFEESFDQKKLESLLYGQASQKGKISLEDIAKLIRDDGASRVTAKAEAAPIIPRGEVDLGSLAAVNAFSGKVASIQIGAPRPQQIADSLAWRLSRHDAVKDKTYSLLEATLKPGQAGQTDVELEKKVFAARKAARQAKKALSKAKQVHNRADARFVTLRKRRAHWRPMLKAQEKRDEAKVEMETRQGVMARAQSRYDNLAKKAAAFKGAPAAGGGPGSDRHAVVEATLQPSGKDGPLELRVPVALELRTVPVSPLTGCEFAETRAAGLWDAVSGKTAAEAVRFVEARFSWHFAGTGRAVLQIAPLILLVVLVLLFVRIGKTAGSYNPFDTGVDVETLPSVGFGLAPLNFVVIVVLPSLACILCIWSLTQIDVVPVAPIFCGLLVLGLGAFCYLRMNGLRSLRDALVRSRRASQTPTTKRQGTL